MKKIKILALIAPSVGRAINYSKNLFETAAFCFSPRLRRGGGRKYSCCT
ncbi:MAG: hypothetical protein LBR79_01660 [Oscillospiraceae bacterium]|nr:hypothetical protein [Oscillospiraceae bacterium]